MANPDNINVKESKRATGGYKGSRAIANRGLPSAREPERNFPAGNLYPERKRLYRAFGLDIGSTDFSKAGVGSGFKDVREAYFENPGSQIIIRGSKSPSVRTGRADVDLATRRAEAARAALIKEGIPADSIRIEEMAKSNLDPRTTPAKQKAAMRGAEIEIIPPHKLSRVEKSFSDELVPVEDKKPPRIEFPRKFTTPIPDFEPWLKKHVYPSVDKALNRAKDAAQNTARKIASGGLLLLWLPELADAVGIQAVLHFLPLLVEAAAEEYGKQKVERYVKEKLKKRLQNWENERNRTEEDHFMNEMLSRIKAGGLDPTAKHHPLYFLVNPETLNWKSRKVDDETGVQPGHTLSHKGYGFALALEAPISNQRWRADKIETPGGFAFSGVYKIDDVYVDRKTAEHWEQADLLPAGTCKNAPKSVGWIDF